MVPLQESTQYTFPAHLGACFADYYHLWPHLLTHIPAITPTRVFTLRAGSHTRATFLLLWR